MKTWQDKQGLLQLKQLLLKNGHVCNIISELNNSLRYSATKANQDTGKVF
jgi:hypothetical protein